MSSHFPTILAIDSTLRRCSVALWHDGIVTADAEEAVAGRQAARLIPLIEQALSDGGMTSYNELSAIACTTGPGSFTGIRIGLATARAIAFAAAIPVAGMTSLEVMAWQVAVTHSAIREEGSNSDNSSTSMGMNISIVMNAYRGEIYFQSFVWRDGSLHPVTQPQALTIDEAVNALPDGGVLAGDAQNLVTAGMAKNRLCCCPDITYPTATALAELAAHKQRFTKGSFVQPLYVRPPDAKLPATPTS